MGKPKFKLDTECKFYPCHKGLEDCTFCYCPIYPCGYEEFGKFIEGKNGKVWDCSDCVVFHKKKIIEGLGGQGADGSVDINKYIETEEDG